MNDPVTGYAMPKYQQTRFNFTEADEVSQEDLEAAAEKFDNIKVNPDKYFTTKYHDAKKIILTLEKAARSCIDKSEKINIEVNGNWTPRRQSFADHAAKKKDRLIKWGMILNTLAIMWDANDVPDLLSKIRSITDLEWLSYHGYPAAPDKDSGEWYLKDYPVLLKKATKLGLKSKEDAERLHTLLESLGSIKLTPQQEQEKLLKEELKKVHSYNIPGFYPTPDSLIEEMLGYAEIRSGMRILEPSAGIGSIADMIRDRYPNCFIHCVEMQHSLTHILRLKEFQTTGADIMGLEKDEIQDFDRIIMNPPFEKGQDMDHVRRCFDRFLRPGGILISVMSSGSISGSTMKHRDFRDFREKHHAYYVENGQAFRDSFNSTGVSSVILVVSKEI